MINKNQLFLETTIQVSKIFGYPNIKRKEINKIIKQNSNITSNYVWKEYNCGFIKAAVDFYNLLTISEDVSEALRGIQKIWGRKKDKTIDIFSIIIEISMKSNKPNNPKEYKDELLSKLDYMIEIYLKENFFKDVDKPLLDSTKCSLGCSEPKKDKENNMWEFKPLCNKKDLNLCNIEDFVVENKEKIKKFISVYLQQDKNDAEINKRIEVAKKIIDKKDIVHGNNCKALSDWIITLEVPKDTTLFTTNGKHFDLPCDILGLNLKQL